MYKNGFNSDNRKKPSQNGGPFRNSSFQFYILTGNLLSRRSAAEHVNISVYKLVHDIGQNQGSCDICHRMLFQKYGGHADGHHDDKGNPADPSMILQAFAVHDADVYTQRIVYMDARKYIGRGVAVMDFLHQIAENILMRIYLHAQVCAIRVKGADHHADGHADK